MKLYFATSNPNKLSELQTFLRENNIGLELDMIGKDIIEPAIDDLAHIAAYKAELAMNELRSPVIAEDTGLFIESLNGFPGSLTKNVYEKIGLEGLLTLLQGKSRKATFKTAIALAIPHKKTVTFIGEIEGDIAESVRGKEGWGHDPIFIPKGETKTWAEDYTLKRDNHRTRALQKLVDYLKSNPFKA